MSNGLKGVVPICHFLPKASRDPFHLRGKHPSGSCLNSCFCVRVKLGLPWIRTTSGSKRVKKKKKRKGIYTISNSKDVIFFQTCGPTDTKSLEFSPVTRVCCQEEATICRKTHHPREPSSNKIKELLWKSLSLELSLKQCPWTTVDIFLSYSTGRIHPKGPLNSHVFIILFFNYVLWFRLGSF